MSNIQFPTKNELLNSYLSLLTQTLTQLQKTEPGNIEKHDPFRLQMQAVIHHLKHPSQ